MKRLFVGIELDDAARAFVERAASMLTTAGVRARFELPEKFHVTIAFLGSTDEERLASLREALAAACAACTPFDLTLDSLGAFPDARRARILWVGPARANAAFTVCGDAVSNAFAAAGWELDRKPQPHITICRLKSSPAPLPRLAEHLTIRVDQLALFESKPAGPTTRYEVIERFSFGPS